MTNPSTPIVGPPDRDAAAAADGFDKGTYGRSFADVYDEWYSELTDASATAAFVSRFGTALDVLELGVGSGRLAAAIEADGHRVTGLDISPEMLVESKTLAIRADMAHLPLSSRSFDVVLVATNTLFNLVEFDDQRRCLADAARCLRHDGRLVIEAFVPADDDRSLDRVVTTRSISAARVVLTATIRDSDQQIITGQHIEITEGGIRLRPWRVRYCRPEELDRMTHDAGLTLEERFGGWDLARFGPDDANHISVYAPARGKSAD